jgi:hypothetical protein
MTDELTQERRDNSADITTYPYSCQERAAIYIYEAGMSEEEADARAIREMEADDKSGTTPPLRGTNQSGNQDDTSSP